MAGCGWVDVDLGVGVGVGVEGVGVSRLAGVRGSYRGPPLGARLWGRGDVWRTRAKKVR